MPPYHRASGLVLHWTSQGLVCTAAGTGERFSIPLDVLGVLARLDGRTTARQMAERHPELGDRAHVTAAMAALERAGLAASSGAATGAWAAWTPEAAFYHFGTRATRFPTSLAKTDRAMRAKARREPPPPPVKSVSGPSRALPAPALEGNLAGALMARRTWRNFSRAPIALGDLATLLQLTFGVQRRGSVPGQGPVVLKTSPSGGARHPIEATVLAVNVRGLRPGVYHYDAGLNRLTNLKRPMTRGRLVKLLGGQPYFSGAAAVVVMSAVFARSMWKYPSSRAYRAILIDAGHLGQTFCLVATALGLAPFSTMAFCERDLDPVIGADGVSESAMYVVGVGSRPAGHAGRPGRITAR